MNLLDYIIIIVMAILVVKGVIRGFIREALSLAGIGFGILLGIIYQPELTNFLKAYVPDGKYLPLLSLAAIFIFVFVFCNVLGWLLRLIFKKVLLGWLDRMLGAVFAVLKGIVIIYVSMVLITFFVPTKAPLIAGSTLAPWIIRSYQSIIGIISPDQYQNWKKKIAGETSTIGAKVSEKIKDVIQGEI